MGCTYCYARYTHEFLDLEPRAFEDRIYAKQNVAAHLRRDLHRVRPGQSIAIGTATDPYQPAEKRYARTRRILEVLLEWEGLDFSITTKSNLVTRDLDLLIRLAERHQMGVNVTITTLNRRLAGSLEPKAPRPDLRLKAISEMTAAGVPAGILCAPVLPDINDHPDELDALAGASAKAGASWFMASPLFLMPSAQRVFFPSLERDFPDLVDRYRERYARSAYLPETYQHGLEDLVRRLQAKHAMVGSLKARRGASGTLAGPQLSLFE